MKKIVMRSIFWYQKFISRGVFIGFFSNQCRFYPSCSQYAYQSVARYGTIKGLFLGLERIFRCHPLAKGGIDPLK